MRNSLRVACLTLGLAMFGATPVQAQNTELYGSYCGRVTWDGRGPIDTWIIFLRGERYSTALTVGAFTDASEGTRSQSGASVIMRSNDAPHYVMTTIVGDGRINGTVTNDRGERGVISLSQMRGTGGGLRSSPVPPDFEPQSARSVLAGNWEDLQRFTTWGWTAQGSDYWRSAYNAGPPLPADARAAIEDWIRRYEAGEQPRCGY